MLSVVKVLVARNAMEHESKKWRCSPLHYAIAMGHMEVVQYLVEVAMADVDVFGLKGVPLLAVAAKLGECVTLKCIHGRKHNT